MAPSLSSLPHEILGEICAMLCCHCSPPVSEPENFHYGQGAKALASLSLTCKVLCAIAQPILYHQAYPRRHILLLRTLIARPDLASAVRALSKQGDEELAEVEFSAIEAAATRVGVILPEGWREGGGDTIPTRVFDLILACTTGIESLEFTCALALNVAELLSGSSVLLLSLRYLSMSHWDTESGFDLAQGEELFKLAPNIEHIHAHMCSSVSPNLLLRNVKSLQFTLSTLTANDIELAIQACPRLEQFSYETGGTIVSDEEEFTPAEVMRALRTRKETLKHLDLDFGGGSDEYPSRGEALEQDDLFGSFAEFSRLETLIVPVEYIFGDDDEEENETNTKAFPSMLPGSLQFLGLPNGADGYVEALAMAIGSGQFPELETFAMSKVEGMPGELKSLLDGVGVDYVVYDPDEHRLPLPRWPGF